MIEIVCAFILILSCVFAGLAVTYLDDSTSSYRPEVPITMGIIAIAFALMGLTIVIARKG